MGQYDGWEKAAIRSHLRARAIRNSKFKKSNKWALTEKQLDFVMAYSDPRSPTYRNATQSIIATHEYTTYKAANVQAAAIMKIQKIKMALKDLLKNDKIDSLIHKGVETRLAEPNSPHWQATADFVAKVRGEFAPDKHVNVNLTAEDRDKKYEDINKLLEKKTTPEEPTE